LTQKIVNPVQGNPGSNVSAKRRTNNSQGSSKKEGIIGKKNGNSVLTND